MVDICIMSPSPARQEWLRRAVAGERGIHLTGAAATFPFLRSLITETPVDLAVIDPTSKIESSVVREWTLELADLIAMLVLSSEPDPAMFNIMLNGQTGGILSADASSQQIIQAIHTIASGLMVFDGAFVTREAAEPLPMESLTP